MAPKRAKAVTNPDDSDDASDKPMWDSSERNLQLYLQPLKRWLPRQHSQLNNFLRYGYIINGKQETVVFDNDHKRLLADGSIVAGSFESPWFQPGEESDDEECEGK